MSQVVKTNDTGIDLKAAGLPSSAPADDDVSDSEEEKIPAAAPTPMPAAPDPRLAIIATEDRKVRRELIMTIQTYYKSPIFAKYLAANDLVEDPSLLTIEEMKMLLVDIKFTIRNKNTSSMIQQVVPRVIAGLEPIVSVVYDVKGVSKQLMQQPTFIDLIEEIRLESVAFTDSSPRARLLYEVVSTCVVVNGANTHAAAVKAAKEAKDKDITISAATAALL
jgi:hypothetical protein